MPESERVRTHVGEMLKRHLLALAVGSVLVLLVVSAAVGSLPSACSRCHSDQTSTLRAGGHANLNCYDCHLDDGAWGFAEQKTLELTRMYPAAVTQAGFRQPARTTSRLGCLSCHDAVLNEITEVRGLRIKHSVCAPDATCDNCHSAVAHPTSVRWVSVPVMEKCTECHERNAGPTKCDTCHLGDRETRSTVKGPWQVTHGENWQTTHGMGDQKACGSCHPAGYCAKCHRVPVPHTSDFGASHGEYAIKDLAACLVCHKSEKTFCEGCHGTPMPHPAIFLPGHAKLARGTADKRCQRCHTASDCEDCHANHVHPGAGTGVPVPWTLTPESLRP